MMQDGISLIEIVVVVAITSLLLLFAGIEYKGWITRYNVESQIKTIYSDLMNARLRAMERNRVHFVSLSANRYTVKEDTNPAPNGDGTLDSSDTLVLQKNTKSSLSYEGGGTIEFNTRGLVMDPKTICIRATENPLLENAKPPYDCIILSTTRINMGKMSDNGSVCNADNCEAR